MSEDQLARIPVDEGEAGVDDWQITYGDMVTLLLCFFVLLFSMSTIDPAKFEMTTAALTEQISGEKPLMPIAEVIAELRAAVQRNKLEEEVTISSDGSGVVIEFASPSSKRPSAFLRTSSTNATASRSRDTPTTCRSAPWPSRPTGNSPRPGPRA